MLLLSEGFCAYKKLAVPSIAKIIEGANWIEREIHELFGVEFIKHPELKPLLTENNEKIPKKPLRVERKDMSKEFNLPVGPFHPLLEEAEYFKVKIDGERVVDIEMETGWMHRV